MNPRTKGYLPGFVLAVGVLVLGWWFFDGSTTRSRTIRSRLTIVVETPEGDRTGSSVTESKIYFPGGLTSAQGWGLTEELVGETVIVDLGQRGLLFSTFERQPLRGGDAYNADLTPFPHQQFPGKYSANASENDKYAAYLDVLNRLKPKADLALRDLPVLVRFTNPADPKTAALVDPLNLAASFGSGVTLKSSSIQITDDPISHGIEARLPWLKSSKFAAHLLPGINRDPNPPLVVRLTYDDFRRLHQ